MRPLDCLVARAPRNDGDALSDVFHRIADQVLHQALETDRIAIYSRQRPRVDFGPPILDRIGEGVENLGENLARREKAVALCLQAQSTELDEDVGCARSSIPPSMASS
jgi:hypothetical protein